MDKISEKYKKYIVEIKLNREKKLFVSGMNISKDYDDFLLIDIHDKILIFNNLDQIKTFILENRDLPDKNNLHKWVREFKSQKPYVTYDIDKIDHIIKTSSGFKELSADALSQIVDLINIVGDYAYQVNHKELILLFEDKSIDLFKELFMDMYIWKENIENPKSDLENLMKDIPYVDFKLSFEKLIILFSQQFSSCFNYLPH